MRLTKSWVRLSTLVFCGIQDINEFGRIGREKERAYSERVEGAKISAFATSSKTSQLIRGFSFRSGFDLDSEGSSD